MDGDIILYSLCSMPSVWSKVSWQTTPQATISVTQQTRSGFLKPHKKLIRQEEIEHPFYDPYLSTGETWLNTC